MSASPPSVAAMPRPPGHPGTTSLSTSWWRVLEFIHLYGWQWQIRGKKLNNRQLCKRCINQKRVLVTFHGADFRQCRGERGSPSGRRPSFHTRCLQRSRRAGPAASRPRGRTAEGARAGRAHAVVSNAASSCLDYGNPKVYTRSPGT